MQLCELVDHGDLFVNLDVCFPPLGQRSRGWSWKTRQRMEIDVENALQGSQKHQPHKNGGKDIDYRDIHLISLGDHRSKNKQESDLI